jgi:hypothetical protein
MRPVRVEVITYAPTVFRHCQHCEVAFAGVGLGERIHRAEAKDALPDDLIAEFQHVSDWLHGLVERHGPRVSVSVIDAASIEGVWKSLRHRVRRYPAVVVDGEERRVGNDFAAVDTLIDQRLERAAAAAGAGEPERRGS